MSLYLYGFVPAGTEGPPSSIRGVGGAPVRMVDLDPVRAALSEVPSDDFTPERLEERVRDLEWLSEQGALHERVVTWFVDAGGILPVRFLTLHTDEESLRNQVGPRAAELAARLERLDGLREWDLKVSYDAERLEAKIGAVSEEVADLDRQIDEAGPGKRYLLEKKRDKLARTESSRAALRVAMEAYEELADCAERARRLALPSEGGRDARVVLNAALLVRRTEEERVCRRADEVADRLRELGLDVEFTGPWAPYRFLDDETEGGDPQ